jgi:alanine racemase
MGYADGLPRVATGGPLRVDGVTYPVAGRIAMDQMVIDLGGQEVSAGGKSLLGAEAELFGNGADGGPTADDWARAAGTNNYEIVTRISPRVPRRYINESETPLVPVSRS